MAQENPIQVNTPVKFGLFDQHPVTLRIRQEEEHRLQEVACKLFGRVLSDSEYVELVCAHPGDTVILSVKANPQDPTEQHISIQRLGSAFIIATFSHCHYRNYIGLGPHPQDPNRPGLYMQLVEVNSDGQHNGIAAHILAEQVQCAQRLGYDRISGIAERKGNYVGYYAFARLGFDRVFLPERRKALPTEFSQVVRLSDLMKLENGREWWLQNGWPVDVEFDVAPNSASVAMLKAYFAEKGWSWIEPPYVAPAIVRE